MEFQIVFEAFLQIMDIHIIFIMVAATFGGMLIGALPGLTTTMGVALMLPIAFRLPVLEGIMCMISVYCASTYGGSIAAILLNTPGTPAAAATALDGNVMARKGRAGLALSLALYSSVFGGLTSALMFSIFAPAISRFALKFGPPEYFCLALFGLTMTAYVSGRSILKGIIAGSIGILLAMVGLDPLHGVPRMTYGVTYFMGEIGFIPVLIGVFAIPEVFTRMFDTELVERMQRQAIRIQVPIRDLLANIGALIRSALTGVMVGAIPATGPDIAAFVSYGIAKQISSKPDTFGKGDPRGVMAAEAANNGCTGGALITGLSIGVPGDAAVAVIMGALMMQGLAPGPLLFQTNAIFVYAIFVGMFVTQLIMFGAGFVGASLFARSLSVPKNILYPTVLVLCVLGSYSVGGNLEDVTAMLVIGTTWFFLSKVGFPSAPVCLGLILGPMLEANFRRMILIHGISTYRVFYTHPIVIITICLMGALMILPRWKGFHRLIGRIFGGLSKNSKI